MVQDDLEYVVIFNEKVNVKIPHGFHDMEDQYIKLKYPLENRPQVIKCNDNMDIDFKYSLMEIDTSESVILYLIEEIKKSVFNFNSSFKKIEDYIYYDENNNTIAGFSFSNEVLDGIAYNTIFLRQFDNYIINASMGCPYENKDQYMKYMEESIKTMKFLNGSLREYE